jgi:hypothetical protein
MGDGRLTLLEASCVEGSVRRLTVRCPSPWARGWPGTGSFARTLHKHGAVPLVQFEPAGVSVAAIAAGDDDNYLRVYADSVRKFGHPVVIGFGHEMNATWYSWGYTHTPASTFVAAWRHIVTLFRSRVRAARGRVRPDVAASGCRGRW